VCAAKGDQQHGHTHGSRQQCISSTAAQPNHVRNPKLRFPGVRLLPRHYVFCNRCFMRFNVIHMLFITVCVILPASARAARIRSQCYVDFGMARSPA
jgi:hypothetical protein